MKKKKTYVYQECESCFKMTSLGLTEIEPDTNSWLVCPTCLKDYEKRTAWMGIITRGGK